MDSASACGVPAQQCEHRAGLYSYSSYSLHIARCIAEIPTQVVWTWLSVTTTYWLIGLNDSGARYIEFALALTLTANAAMSLGYALAIGAPSAGGAAAEHAHRRCHPHEGVLHDERHDDDQQPAREHGDRQIVVGGAEGAAQHSPVCH